ncbi:proline-rich transmembrane protein 1-like [Watersipora subatra]|uniref:proline-rich transmembrane protein 1-like n=1 Tax=Watersipora subatra TaxID=2589382 RepID=UPI00355C5A7A
MTSTFPSAPPEYDEKDEASKLTNTLQTSQDMKIPPPPYPGVEHPTEDITTQLTTYPLHPCQTQESSSFQAFSSPQGAYPLQGNYPLQGSYPPQANYPPQPGFQPQQNYLQGYPPQGCQGQMYVAPPGVVQTGPQQLVVIPTQPGVHQPDHLPFSIFNMLCCCFCIGIVALIKSFDVRSANAVGDFERAKRSSEAALRLNKIALGIGMVIICLYTIAIFVF